MKLNPERWRRLYSPLSHCPLMYCATPTFCHDPPRASQYQTRQWISLSIAGENNQNPFFLYRRRDARSTCSFNFCWRCTCRSVEIRAPFIFLNVPQGNWRSGVAAQMTKEIIAFIIYQDECGQIFHSIIHTASIPSSGYSRQRRLLHSLAPVTQLHRQYFPD